MVNTLKRLALSLALLFLAAPSFGAVKLYTQTGAPATCALGDLWVDTDGTTNDRFYTCTDANTWTKNSGSGGSFDVAGNYSPTGAWDWSGATVSSFPGANIIGSWTGATLTGQTTHTGAIQVLGAALDDMPQISTSAAGIVQVNSSNEVVVDDDISVASISTTAADGSRRSVIPNNTTISPLADGSEEFYNEGGQLKVVEANTEYDLLHSGDVREYIGWAVVDSDTAITVADGKKAATIPATMNGMVLKDFTCAVSDLNSAASGDTTVVLRRVRGATAADMTSTGVTIAYGDYTASDETIDTANDDVATGDKIFIDVNAITTAAQKGLGCTATFGW